jgi:hypothetical protein
MRSCVDCRGELPDVFNHWTFAGVAPLCAFCYHQRVNAYALVTDLVVTEERAILAPLRFTKSDELPLTRDDRDFLRVNRIRA